MHTITTRLPRLNNCIKLWGFPVIYLGWAYLFWSPIFLSDKSVWSFPKVLFFLIGGASPMVAGITLAAITGGRQRLKELWWRLIDVRRIGIRWWVIVLLFWPVFDLFMAKVALLLGITEHSMNIVWSIFNEPSSLIFMLLLSFVFPAVEEVGLRGYWLDELQARFNPLISGIINGSTWALWHTPFVWFPGYYANTTFNPELWWWLPSIVLHTLFIVWVYNKTNRSILAVVLFHAMMNLTGEFLGLTPEMFPFMLVGYVIIVIGFAVYAGSVSD